MTTATKYKTYTQYKPSGIDWLGDIPAGWEYWKVAHLFNKIGSGTTPPSDDMDYYEGDIPWVITGELKDNEIFDSENKVTKKAVQELSALKIFPKDSLLIAMYGATIGKMAILRIPATTNQACCVLGDSKLIDTDFSFYYFLSFRPHLIALSYGGGQPNISQDTIRSIKIFLPVISEQKEIATFLDRETAKIDKMVAKKQKMMELLKEKRQALITHAVTKGLDPKAKMQPSGLDWLGGIPAGWEVKKAKFLSDFVSGYSFDSESYTDDGMPIIRIGDIAEIIDFESVKKVPAELSIGLEKFNIKSGDILLALTGATIGKTAIYNSTEVALLNQRVAILRGKKLDQKYLTYFIASSIFKENIDYLCFGGAQENIGKSEIGSIIISYPKIDEQKQIVTFLDRETAKIDEMVKKVEMQIEKLQEYRQALITNAVTGKIMVN